MAVPRFQPPPINSGREVLPHPALRRPSPAGLRGPAVPYVPGQPFETEAVAGHDDVLHAVASAPAAVPFGEQQRHPFGDIPVEFGEAAGRVAVAEVLPPAPLELVDLINQQVGGDVAA